MGRIWRYFLRDCRVSALGSLGFFVLVFCWNFLWMNWYFFWVFLCLWGIYVLWVFCELFCVCGIIVFVYCCLLLCVFRLFKVCKLLMEIFDGGLKLLMCVCVWDGECVWWWWDVLMCVCVCVCESVGDVRCDVGMWCCVFSLVVWVWV